VSEPLEPSAPAPGAWEKAIDPALSERLLRPATQPGVVRRGMLQSVIARASRLSQPVPLLGAILQRQGVHPGRVPQIPVVHARPAEPALPTSAAPVTHLPSPAERPVQRTPVVTPNPVAPPADSAAPLPFAQPIAPAEPGQTRGAPSADSTASAPSIDAVAPTGDVQRAEAPSASGDSVPPSSSTPEGTSEAPPTAGATTATDGHDGGTADAASPPVVPHAAPSVDLPVSEAAGAELIHRTAAEPIAESPAPATASSDPTPGAPAEGGSAVADPGDNSVPGPVIALPPPAGSPAPLLQRSADDSVSVEASAGAESPPPADSATPAPAHALSTDNVDPADLNIPAPGRVDSIVSPFGPTPPEGGSVPVVEPSAPAATDGAPPLLVFRVASNGSDAQSAAGDAAPQPAAPATASPTPPTLIQRTPADSVPPTSSATPDASAAAPSTAPAPGVSSEAPPTTPEAGATGGEPQHEHANVDHHMPPLRQVIVQKPAAAEISDSVEAVQRMVADVEGEEPVDFDGGVLASAAEEGAAPPIVPGSAPGDSLQRSADSDLVLAVAPAPTNSASTGSASADTRSGSGSTDRSSAGSDSAASAVPVAVAPSPAPDAAATIQRTESTVDVSASAPVIAAVDALSATPSVADQDVPVTGIGEENVPVVQASAGSESIQRAAAPEMVLATGGAPVEAVSSDPAPVVGIGSSGGTAGSVESAAPPIPVVQASGPGNSLQRALAEALVLASASASASSDADVPVVSVDATSPRRTVQRAPMEPPPGTVDAAPSTNGDASVPVVPAAAAAGETLGAAPDMIHRESVEGVPVASAGSASPAPVGVATVDGGVSAEPAVVATTVAAGDAPLSSGAAADLVQRSPASSDDEPTSGSASASSAAPAVVAAAAPAAGGSAIGATARSAALPYVLPAAFGASAGAAANGSVAVGTIQRSALADSAALPVVTVSRRAAVVGSSSTTGPASAPPMRVLADGAREAVEMPLAVGEMAAGEPAIQRASDAAAQRMAEAASTETPAEAGAVLTLASPAADGQRGEASRAGVVSAAAFEAARSGRVQRSLALAHRTPAARETPPQTARPVPAAGTSESTGGVAFGQMPSPLAAGAPAMIQRQTPSAGAETETPGAQTSPPPGGPPAELPTVSAQSEKSQVDVGDLANRVYELLVRRLLSERRQQGW
jgi:hypothetical protein